MREKGFLLVESKSRHESCQLTLLVEGTVTDIDVDKNTVGGGTDAGEEATKGYEATSKIGPLTSANGEGLASSETGEIVGRLGIMLQEDVQSLC